MDPPPGSYGAAYGHGVAYASTQPRRRSRGARGQHRRPQVGARRGSNGADRQASPEPDRPSPAFIATMPATVSTHTHATPKPEPYPLRTPNLQPVPLRPQPLPQPRNAARNGGRNRSLNASLKSKPISRHNDGENEGGNSRGIQTRTRGQFSGANAHRNVREISGPKCAPEPETPT